MMDADTIRDRAVLASHEVHQLALFQNENYTEQELLAARRFLNSAFEAPPKTRTETVARFIRFLPNRGEEGLVALIQAMRADGYSGPFFDRI